MVNARDPGPADRGTSPSGDVTAVPDTGQPPNPDHRPSGIAAVEAALAPLTRTGRYYAGAWRHYLGRREGALPLALPSPALVTHALRDEVVLIGLRTQRPLSSGAAFDRIEKEVHAALEFYGAKGWLDNPELLFASPPPLTDMKIHPVRQRGRTYERFVFTSGYTPEEGDPGRERWLSYTANEQVYGLMLRHSEPRPWLVCIHGTEMGRAALDLTLFRAWHLHDDLGLNIAIPVLPQHGPRARGLPKGKAFPGEEILDDGHFAAQAVWDVRRLLSWIRAQEPGQRIGLNSISMGGFVAALVASIDDDLTCAVLGVPVADLVELLGRHAGFHRGDPRLRVVELARPLGRMVSPLSLTPKVPMAGRFIYGGVADRLVHPHEQVVRLWEHWGKPEIVWYRGGHTGFFTARPVQKFIDDAIVQSGLVGGDN